MSENSFLKVVKEIDGVTIVHPWALEALWNICRQVEDLPFPVAECGVYRGGTLRLLARALPDRTIWGFDTFTGIPFEMVRAFDKHLEGEFGDTSFDKVAAFLSDLRNIKLVQGVFPSTFIHVPPDERFSLVHLDCDQYDSYLASLDFFMPRLVDGGYLVVDDYLHCEGAKRAIDERFPDVEKPPYILECKRGFETLVTRKDLP